jgi:hypothetical protein
MVGRDAIAAEEKWGSVAPHLLVTSAAEPDAAERHGVGKQVLQMKNSSEIFTSACIPHFHLSFTLYRQPPFQAISHKMVHP